MYGINIKLTAVIYSLSLLLPQQLQANNLTIENRLNLLLGRFSEKIRLDNSGAANNAYQDSIRIRYQSCQNYPYHNNVVPAVAYRLLNRHIKQGLERGFQCLLGNGPMGKLHPYHEGQAVKLLSILEDQQWKTFRCVKDKTFAYAVANSRPREKMDLTDSITRDLPFPGVVLDTFRISGFISDKFDEETYRQFFKLNEEQIGVLRTGKPLRVDGSHRYKNLPALMFHEMVHWLGHEHSGYYPDITHLYETCCFGGSDYIEDEQLNRKFQQKACAILKDKELWQTTPYRQMRLWRFKEYDQLKRNMRDVQDTD